MKRVGTCSICGGDVFGVRGAWMSTNPPPPDTCRQCGAVAASDIIPMVPRPGPRRPGWRRREYGPAVWPSRVMMLES